MFKLIIINNKKPPIQEAFCWQFFSIKCFYINITRGIIIPNDELQQFVDAVKITESDDKLLNTAEKTFQPQLKAAEQFADDLGKGLEKNIKNLFQNKEVTQKSIQPYNNLTTTEKGNYLFNDIGCDFRGRYIKLDTSISKNTKLFTDLGPTRQRIGTQYSNQYNKFKLGVEHKRDVGAIFTNYEHNTGVGKILIEGKVSKDVSGISASYSENNLKISASFWEKEGYQINFEKNFQTKNSEINIGGGVNNTIGYIYGRIIL